MKRYIITLILVAMFSISLRAQVNSQNYVNARTMLNPEQTSYIDNITYYDGIGRSLQNVEAATYNGTAKGTTVATLQEYDNAGRQSNQWLPIPINGTYLDPSQFKTRATGTNGHSDTNPYTQPVYEASPLNRIAQQYGAGSAWRTNNNSIKTEYLTNTNAAPLNCKLYSVNGNNLAGGTAYYTGGTLQVVKTTDEDSKVSYTFTDKLGRTILQRVMNGSESLDTYFVYDNRGNLRFVLQPEYQDEANLNKFAFQYRYNQYNLCSWKKLPGAEHIEYTYNSNGLLVKSEDGNQRAAGTSTTYTYDGLYRITAKNGITYRYDNYCFIGQGDFSNSNYTAGNTNYSKGKLTAKEVTVIGNNSTAKICTVYHYDQKGRTVKTVQNNIMGGYDITETSYTYTNKPAVVIHTHSATGKTTRTEVTTYSYDEKDRISKITHKLGNNAEVTLVTYTYDAYGRVTEKKFHNANTVQYQYNLRNWVTSITATKFKQDLYYNTGNGASCYNGNISSTTWKSGNDAILRGYKFTYDGANRMTGGTYGEGTAISSNADRFSESATYDKNGNIVTLQRRGQTGTSAYAQLDNLTYTYNGNQVTKIEDAATAVALSGNTAFTNGTSTSNEYTYDANGNITKDSNKGISNIRYNLLNLPEEVTFTNGNSIKFFYSAEGEKLKVEYVIGGTTTNTCYCANVVYENNNQKYLLNDEGYYDLGDINGGYHYYLKDHLGNNRVVINQSGAVQQINNYYPYGGLFASSTTGTTNQPYKYNGKEFDTHAGLNWYDYGARHYDPAIARWTTQDPLADMYYPHSPYSYCTNNPIKYVDENGEWIANVVGAVLGGAVEYAGQVVANKLSGKGWTESFTNVDVGDIVVATIEGGLTAGTSIIRRSSTKAAVGAVSSLISNAVNVEYEDGHLTPNVAPADEFVFDSTVGAVCQTVKTSKKVKVLQPGTVSKQKDKVLETKRANGEVFDPKLEEAQAKDKIQTAKEVNSTTSEHVNSLIGNGIYSFTKGDYEKYKKQK